MLYDQTGSLNTIWALQTGSTHNSAKDVAERVSAFLSQRQRTGSLPHLGDISKIGFSGRHVSKTKERETVCVELQKILGHQHCRIHNTRQRSIHTHSHTTLQANLTALHSSALQYWYSVRWLHSTKDIQLSSYYRSSRALAAVISALTGELQTGTVHRTSVLDCF